MTTVIKKSELAAHLGVTRARVSHLIARGLPVRPDKRVDLELALEWMRANVGQQARFTDRGIHRIIGAGPTKPAEPAPVAETVLDDDTAVLPFAAAKALRETFLARKARLEFQKEAGKLLSAPEVESRWARIIGDCRNRLLAVPSRIGSRLSHLTNVEIEAIDREIRAAMSELGA